MRKDIGLSRIDQKQGLSRLNGRKFSLDLSPGQFKVDDDRGLICAWAFKCLDLKGDVWVEYVDRNDEHITEDECVDLCMKFSSKPLAQRKMTLDHGPLVIGHCISLYPLTREFLVKAAGENHGFTKTGGIAWFKPHEDAYPMIKQSLMENGYRRFSIGGWWGLIERE